MVPDVFSNKRCRGKGATLKLQLVCCIFENSASCLFLADRFRCSLMNVRSEMRVFHDLLRHFSGIRDFTGRNNRTSVISSSGKNSRNI
jgi:hypothetical protein